MPDVTQEQLAQQVHAQGMRFVMAVTGGGSGAISALLGVAGASRSILAATVPYADLALVEWLGGRPDEFCAPATARAMAMAAFLKAQQYDPGAQTCGLACTASLRSDRPKRGAHRAHLAYQTASTTGVLSLELEKGQRSRAEEEAVVASLVLNLVAETCGATGRLSVALAQSEQVAAQRVVAPSDQQDLLAGRTLAVQLNGLDPPRPLVVFPGAFHPLHAGHQKMAEVARQILGHDVAYEISILNVDKPPLDFLEIDQRVRQFSARQAVWLTRAPHFTEKADLLPGATFVVGADTIARVGHPRYYGGQVPAMQAALEQIAAAGCRFLVFGRLLDGTFRTLSELQLPATLAALCQEVPEDSFRQDIAATELRRQARSE